MSAKRPKPLTPTFVLSLAIAIFLLTTPAWLNTVTAQAQDLNNRHQPTATKLSRLLKGDKHKAHETVTVIVTLSGPRSAGLNALLKNSGVRHRREMKNLGSFSVTLPFQKVAQLASFPEVDFVTTNE